MSTTNSKDDFKRQSIQYWSKGYQNDSRGAQINDPTAYAEANRDNFKFLYDKILSYAPASVLEVGCNAGGHLNHLKKLEPELEIAGIELNEKAIHAAHEHFDTKDWTLLGGNVLDAATWEQLNRKFDVVFTCALLMVISEGSDKRYVINQILNATGKAVVFFESHSFEEGIMDVRKDDSHSPYSIDNYSRYADFEIHKVEPMRDYPDMYQALICKEV